MDRRAAPVRGISAAILRTNGERTLSEDEAVVEGQPEAISLLQAT